MQKSLRMNWMNEFTPVKSIHIPCPFNSTHTLRQSTRLQDPASTRKSGWSTEQTAMRTNSFIHFAMRTLGNVKHLLATFVHITVRIKLKEFKDGKKKAPSSKNKIPLTLLFHSKAPGISTETGQVSRSLNFMRGFATESDPSAATNADHSEKLTPSLSRSSHICSRTPE